MKALVINDTTEKLNEQFLSTWTQKVTTELQTRGLLPTEKAALELSLVFLNSHDAKQINWTHRQKDHPTDVLSFQTDDPECFGELVFCPEVIRKQAQQHKMQFEAELGYLIIHGILHLLGFDHEKNEDEAKKMMGLQDEVFALLTKPAPKAKKTAKKPPKKAAAQPAKTAKKATQKKPSKAKAVARKKTKK